MNRTRRTPLAASAACPACDRYTGMATTCPYCGLDTPYGPVLKRMRLGAIVLAGAGLVFLYLAARSGYPHPMPIGDLTPRMNGTTIRIGGRVATPPYIWPPEGPPVYVSFMVDDGTGALGVSVSRPFASRMATIERLPKHGQDVEMTGRLTVDLNGRRRLRIEDVGGLLVLSARPAAEQSAE